MPIQPYNFSIDPRERIEREQRRLQRLTDPKTYAPGGSRRQPAMPRGSTNVELTDEARRGLLSSIGQNTLGALYKFANVLELPASSIRDVASTATGTPRNPFDQWLHPTTEEGRVRGRELNRQWGLAGPEDNWKNLFGGIATEIALDPLTYLGFGANALTKHGQLLKRAGTLDRLPDFRYWRGVERARKGASPLNTMGKREALQEITSAEDIIKYLGRGANDVGDPVLQKQAREAVDEAAKAVGYGDYADFLAKEGQEALSGVTRFGLPNWRIFGANPKDMLRQAPGKILGTPGSQGAKRYARTMDEAFRGIGEFMPIRHLRTNFSPRLAAMLHPIAQRAAPAYKTAEEIGEGSARRLSRDAVMDFEQVFGEDWNTLLNTTSDEEALAIHDKFRGFFELGNATETVGQRQAVDSVTNAIATQYTRAKNAGAAIEELDDDFIRYFPSELSEGLDSGWINQLRELDPASTQTLPTSAFSQHLLARIGPLRDLPGGRGTVNKLWTDPTAIAIKAEDIPRDEMKEKLVKHISNTYGQGGDRSIPITYRGIRLDRTNLENLPPIRRDDIRTVQAKVYGEGTFTDIANNPNLNEVDKKQLMDARLRDMGVRTESNWVYGDEGAEITGDTRLWEIRNDRHQVLADMFLNSPDEAHKRGLFGNLPLYDAENYFQRMEDSINRANFTLSMLSHPQALRSAEAGDVGGETLRQVLMDLSLDPDVALPKLATQHGRVKGSLTDEAYRQVLDNFGKKTVEMGLNRDLKRYKQFFEGPEGANFMLNIYDNAQKVFKAAVTSPWPAFHGRNIATGLLREAIQGRVSMRDVNDTFRALAGKKVRKAADIPFVQKRWADMQGRIPDLSGQTLTDDQAHKILMSTAGEVDMVGSYQLHEAADAVTDMRAMGGAESTQLPAGAGRARYFKGMTPGSYGFSVPNALRTYVGKGKKLRRQLPGGGFTTIKAPPTSTGVLPNVTPFPNVDLPFWLGRKGIAKGFRALSSEEALRKSTKLSNWADEPFLRQPKEWRVPGVDESLGFKGREGMKFSELPDSRTYGPVAGGREFAYAAEFINRFEPWLNLVRKGWDPHKAAREIAGSAGSQISYATKHFTPFEQQWMKRLVPFYSFTSRSVPWSIRKFYEEPHNPLSQIIRGTKRTGEHLQEQHGQEVGPIPAHIRDSLAIPLQSEHPGTKRFFTGADVMSQDLWQLAMPLMSGQGEQTLFEMASRANPLLKFLAESVTGTSLWQRGVEEGRPIRNMSPTLGRTIANLGQSWEELSGEKYPSSHYERLSQPGLLDRVASSSPYSRLLSTVRTLADVRKGPMAKGLRLGLGAGITDIGPRQQQAILREYLRSMIGEAGGMTFEKATFSKEDLAKMDPEERHRALQLKSLADEQAEIAKDLREKARLGLPGY